MALVPGNRLGPYEILSALGSGGMGHVYRARDTRLDRVVAIKVLKPDLMSNPDGRRRLACEAQAVAALSHPHICALHDFASHNGIDYLVMEYLEGESLAERLMAGPLPLADLLRYSLDIADALEHAHRRGFVHRDLNPGNVMVTKPGAVLLDFGLAKSVAGAAFVDAEAPSGRPATQDLTDGDRLRGTLPYMAPEVLEGGEADARSDIFAFGALVYEMATGRTAFDGRNQANVIATILSADPPPMTELQPLVPPALDRLVQKCLAKDPDERWQSAHDLKAALGWMSDPDVSDCRVRAGTAPVNRRERLAWTTAIVVLLITVAAIALRHGTTERNPASTNAEPVRFSVAAPANATLFSGGGVMALSPDGRHLALVATPRGGHPRLWIRSLDSELSRPLVATTGASQPFWSPDSRFVAFFAGGKLQKVDVASGEVQQICDAEGLAGTWSRSGVILFRSDTSRRIERVPVAGGTPQPVPGLDASPGGAWLYWPQFLPDGRRFLYLVKSTEPHVSGIYVASLDGLGRTRVLSDESQAIYVSPGYLVFRREATLFVQRFDPASLALSGDALPLVDNVAFNLGTSRGVFSVSDTGVLAYRTPDDSVLSWLDRQGRVLSTVGPPGAYNDPAISPNGKTVALARLDRQLGNDDIWLIDSERGSATPFTYDPAWDRAPVWSPDGARIIFASRRGAKVEIYAKSSSGGTVEQLLLSPSAPALPLDWSRNGRLMIFAQANVKTRFDLWALPLLDQSQPVRLLETAANEERAQLSPDGRWLAYDSNEQGSFEVYVTPFPHLTGQKWQISATGGVEPKWRHDGGELFYLSADQRLMAVTVRGASTFQHDAPRVLFETAATGTGYGIRGRNQYDVAPDGRFLFNVASRESSMPISIVLNWPALLPR